jgi:hypothetical protein
VVVSVFVDELVFFMTVPPDSRQRDAGRHTVCSRYTGTLHHAQVDCKEFFAHSRIFIPTLEFVSDITELS